MAYENFIPTVWAEAINRELEKALVYAEGCNRQYDGEVKAMGDTVRILGVGRPTITTTTDKAITLSAPESVEDSSVTLAVRQISYFNYKVDDIDKRQAVGGVMEALNKEATYGLADEMDKHIAGMAATRAALVLHAPEAGIHGAGHRQQQNAGERPRGQVRQRYCKDEQQRRRGFQRKQPYYGAHGQGSGVCEPDDARGSVPPGEGLLRRGEGLCAVSGENRAAQGACGAELQGRGLMERSFETWLQLQLL